MKFHRFAQYIYLIIFSTLLCNASVHAQLLITDCHGFTRALHTVKSGELNTVKIAVSNSGGAPLNGAQVTLTNSVTGETITAASQNGFATFQSVAPGSFSVSTTAANATIGTVSVSGAGVSTAAAAGAVGAAGATTGGGGLVVAREVDHQIHSDPEPEPQPDENDTDGSQGGGGADLDGDGIVDPIAEPTVTPIPTVEPTPEATPQRPPTTPRPTPDCEDCDPDAEPEPLDEDDFFKEGNPALRNKAPLSPSK